ASWSDRAIGGLAGFAALFLIGEAYRLMRGREGLGAGDAKLLGALGIWFGWQGLPLLLLTASAIGIAAAMALQWTRGGVDRLTALPFGSFLAVAAWLMPLAPLMALSF
ncbi:MAG: A24 family peptidase, partial [Sphingomonadales bacterium]|nr:A24 family peptidase [Sphingomonadales bacterium]